MVIVVIGNKAEEKRSMGMPFSDNPMILFFFPRSTFLFQWLSVPEINLFFFLFRRGEIIIVHVKDLEIPKL